jgi:hypothetical protein
VIHRERVQAWSIAFRSWSPIWGSGMRRGETPSIVESPGASTDPSGQGGEPPTLASLFRRRMLFGVLGVVLVVGAVAVASRSDVRWLVLALAAVAGAA